MLSGPHIPQSIEDALEVVREILGMDIAYVSRVDPTSQEVLRVVGDSEATGVRAGMVVPIEDTYCDRMLRGRIDNIVRNAAAEPELEGVAGPKAYIGVPLEFHDGAVFGTLCAASGRAQPELAERDVRFMRSWPASSPRNSSAWRCANGSPSSTSSNATAPRRSTCTARCCRSWC